MRISQIIVKEEERGTSTGFEAPVVMAEIAKIININVDYIENMVRDKNKRNLQILKLDWNNSQGRSSGQESTFSGIGEQTDTCKPSGGFGLVGPKMC